MNVGVGDLVDDTYVFCIAGRFISGGPDSGELRGECNGAVECGGDENSGGHLDCQVFVGHFGFDYSDSVLCRCDKGCVEGIVEVEVGKDDLTQVVYDVVKTIAEDGSVFGHGRAFFDHQDVIFVVPDGGVFFYPDAVET